MREVCAFLCCGEFSQSLLADLLMLSLNSRGRALKHPVCVIGAVLRVLEGVNIPTKGRAWSRSRCHRRALGIFLLKGPRGALFFIIELTPVEWALPGKCRNPGWGAAPGCDTAWEFI